MPSSTGKLLTPEGIIILFIAGMFDFAGWICAALVVAFGIGAVLGRIVSVCGFIVIGGWQFSRSGTLPSKKKGNPGKGNPGNPGEGGAAKQLAKKFLKKHAWKLIVEALPVVGDVFPSFIMIVCSELK